MLARASGLFRMCAESGTQWRHDTTIVKEMAVLLQPKDQDNGSSTNDTNLAPPIIVDESTGIVLSQSIPSHIYLGNKFGFNKNIPYPELALQYMHDLNDLHDEMKAAFLKSESTCSLHSLKDYLLGQRYQRHLEAIDRQIKGPYYFGDMPTYVDFMAASYFEMCEGRWLNPLAEAKHLKCDTIAEHAPKLRGVLKGIRGLESASTLESIPTVMANRILTSEQIAAWDN